MYQKLLFTAIAASMISCVACDATADNGSNPSNGKKKSSQTTTAEDAFQCTVNGNQWESIDGGGMVTKDVKTGKQSLRISFDATNGETIGFTFDLSTSELTEASFNSSLKDKSDKSIFMVANAMGTKRNDRIQLAGKLTSSENLMASGRFKFRVVVAKHFARDISDSQTTEFEIEGKFENVEFLNLHRREGE